MTARRLFDASQPGAFRLSLALLVVVDHVFGVHLGLVAVYLFFILSGFWIHRIWDQRYRVGASPYLAFVLSRFSRLIPVMVCAMALAVAVQTLVFRVPLADIAGRFSAVEWLSHVAILGYGQVPGPMLLPPAWTLDLEVQFYLLAPVLYVILTRLGAAPFLTLGAGLAIAAPYLQWGVPVLPYLVLFMGGMAASAKDWHPSAGSQTISLLLALAVLALLVVSGHGQVLFDPGDAPATSRLNWLLAIVLAPVALATVWRRSGHARDAAYGDLSYIVYLLHWPILAWTSALAANMVPGAGLTLFLAMLAAVSYIVWRFVDRPLNDVRTALVARWTRRGKHPETAPGTAGQPA